MSLQNIYALAFGAPDLRQRFIAARIKAAWDIINEAPTTPNHTNRRAWANAVLATPETESANREYRLFLSNSQIQTNGNASPDGDIQYVVNTFCDTYANAAAAAVV